MNSEERAFKEAEYAAFDSWLYKVCPSGDCSLVQFQWEDSQERRAFIEAYNKSTRCTSE